MDVPLPAAFANTLTLKGLEATESEEELSAEAAQTRAATSRFAAI